ncbi:MAG: pentapeptide repeat-containing protein [Ktedonobacteraceae bacterium]
MMFDDNAFPTSPEKWRQHWQSENQPWRTEPEIDAKRQEELSKRRAIVPDIEKGVYPFKGMKLSRAEVEWLLATHENGQGPVDWSNETQRERHGLDLRAADLRQINLASLPLTGLQGGLMWKDWLVATEEQTSMAAVFMEEANLFDAQLQRAELFKAQFQKANLLSANLVQAKLARVNWRKPTWRKPIWHKLIWWKPICAGPSFIGPSCRERICVG